MAIATRQRVDSEAVEAARPHLSGGKRVWYRTTCRSAHRGLCAHVGKLFKRVAGREGSHGGGLRASLTVLYV